jgi:hypothetical protein
LRRRGFVLIRIEPEIERRAAGVATDLNQASKLTDLFR